MKKIFFVLLLAPLFFTSCGTEDALPDTEYVMIKFVNRTGEDIANLTVSRQAIGSLNKGKTSEYLPYDALGEQYGYALVEAVAEINGVKHYTSSACNGVCGTPSAPQGVWLTPGYYKISLHTDYVGGNYMEYRMEK